MLLDHDASWPDHLHARHAVVDAPSSRTVVGPESFAEWKAGAQVVASSRFGVDTEDVLARRVFNVCDSTRGLHQRTF